MEDIENQVLEFKNLPKEEQKRVKTTYAGIGVAMGLAIGIAIGATIVITIIGHSNLSNGFE